MDREMAMWQVLFQADLPVYKLRSAFDRLSRMGASEDPVSLIRELPSLTEAEKARVELDEATVTRAIESGIRLFDTRELGERTASEFVPPKLFLWGEQECLTRTCVAIVGTRAASVYGKAAASKFAEALSRAGLTIISGGALGIDSSAHEAALASGGSTVAVLASGVDRAYPAVHHGLFKRIREKGSLISQFPLGHLPHRHSFIARNAIIAALSHAVLLVEAPEQSGSLSTANAANELGRQVFVVPGNISAQGFRGSHELIRSGATLVDHPAQILEDLGIQSVASPDSRESGLSKEQALIVDSLTVDPLSTEQISNRTGIDAAALLAELTMLELEGKVIRAPGGYALRP